jgi:hypothetical protein
MLGGIALSTALCSQALRADLELLVSSFWQRASNLSLSIRSCQFVRLAIVFLVIGLWTFALSWV